MPTESSIPIRLFNESQADAFWHLAHQPIDAPLTEVVGAYLYDSRPKLIDGEERFGGWLRINYPATHGLSYEGIVALNQRFGNPQVDVSRHSITLYTGDQKIQEAYDFVVSHLILMRPGDA